MQGLGQDCEGSFHRGHDGRPGEMEPVGEKWAAEWQGSAGAGYKDRNC